MQIPTPRLKQATGKEVSVQLQETTKVNETEIINPGDSDPNVFVTVTHTQKKKRQRDEVSPQKFITNAVGKL